MRGRFTTCALLGALAISIASPAAAQQAPITVTGQAMSKWKEAESDHFKIYSDGDEKYLTKLSGRLEAIHYLLKIATNMKEPANGEIVKVKVYAVGDIADVTRLIGDPNSAAAGYYDAQLAGPLSVIPRNSGNDGSFSGELILFHEYAHHFMLQYQAVAYPAWYIEALPSSPVLRRSSDLASLPTARLQSTAKANCFTPSAIRRQKWSMAGISMKSRMRKTGAMAMHGR